MADPRRGSIGDRLSAFTGGAASRQRARFHHKSRGIASLVVLFAFSRVVMAMEFAPVAQMPSDDEGRGGLEFMFSALVGSDSNPTRAGSGDEADDTVTELATGVSYSRRTRKLKLDLGLEGRMKSHSELSEFDLTETVGRANVLWGTRRFAVSLATRLAQLGDPVGVDALSYGVLERQETSIVPGVSLALGKFGLTARYSSVGADFTDSDLEDLDHTDTSTLAEMWFGRPERGVAYLHYDIGAVDYTTLVPARPRYDYDYTKAYAGWRSGASKRTSLDVAIGTWSVESDDFTVPDGTYARVSYSSKLKGGSAMLRAGVEYGPQQSPTADLKTALRGSVAYLGRVNHKWAYSMSLGLENAELTNPDDPAEDTLSLYNIDLALQRNLGSPKAWHGQLVGKIQYEVGDEFNRFKIFLGLGLAR